MARITPKVSVLTPIYNTNPTHLRECIESILNQTFTDFEFLILNDSPENTELDKVVKSYKDDRIKYFKNEKNLGIAPSRNKLLKMARGEYVAIFDHDDISVPTRLEKEVAYLDAHPEIGVVSGWLQYFDKDNHVHQTPQDDGDIRIMLTDNCWVAHTAAMIRKPILVDNNIEYESFYSPAEDYQLWARLIDVTKFHNIQEVLVNYRTYSTNTSNTQKNKMDYMWNQIRSHIADNHTFLRKKFEHEYSRDTLFRMRLFGIIPLLKIKHNWVLLFEFIPVVKLRWK
jgi:glycosyltransferase involved in cell wall biosynthesis